MPDDLWGFALTLYARPGVEAACLRAQARGADVCLLLTGAWLGRRGVACRAERARALKALAAPWRETVVQPLRSLRDAWRDAPEDADLAALRQRLKALELESERVLLKRLEDRARAWAAETIGSPDLGVRAWLDALAGNAAEPAAEALEHMGRAALDGG